jgi:hypothetical protein
MKCVGYFFLLCGLLNASVWGQSAHRTQTYAVVRCAGLSCSASASTLIRRDNPTVKLGTFRSFATPHPGIRTVKREVKLGTFKSFPATFPRLVLGRVSQLEKEKKMETLVGKADAFPLPALIVRR